ncbi:OmpA family protein [Aestuariibius insulae]|uniref:OmpA family protein n=1 Tax=Aestuariibius insulae TaxID=2058287 RepID=UPI00345E7A2C
MRKISLKSTTALLLCLGFALPTLGYAQEAAPETADICPEDLSEADCELLLETQDGEEGAEGTEAGAEAEILEEAEPAEPAEPAGDAIPAEGDVPAEGNEPADGNTAADGSETVQPAPADPTPAEDMVAPAEPAEGNTAADPEAVITETDPAPEPDEPADPDAVVETPEPSIVTEEGDNASPETEETPADEVATDDAVSDDQVVEDAEPTEEAPVEPTEEAPAETAEEIPVEEGETEASDETVTETAPETDTVETEAPDPATEESTAQEDTTEGSEAQTDTEASTETEVATEEPEVIQEDTEESTAAANETPEAEATAEVETEAALDEGDVQTEVVTEETTRSSDEDFETSASGSDNDDEDGLSNLEKFALGAAGLVVLDQIIGQNERVVSNTGDRVVVQRNDGEFYVLKDDNALLRQPGVEVSTRTFDDGSTLQRVNREDGSQVVTIRAANGQVLRRSRILPDGTEILLFDDTSEAEPVEVTELPTVENRSISLETATEEELRAALFAREIEALDRRFTLQQIRQIRAVRELMPVIELDAVTFDTGSAAIRASEVDDLISIGDTMSAVIAENPYEVFLIEGHTDAVGSATSNLALSDRRAESVALALTEYFDVPPENMIVQGYGESNLKIRTQVAERENRRATVRRITPLLRTALVD